MAMNATSAPIGVQDLLCEYQDNPLGIDIDQPRLSWKLMSGQHGTMQSAYQIRMTDKQGVRLWDTGKVPCYKHIRLQPRPGGGLTQAQASYQSLYGAIGSSWRIGDGQFTLTVTVPTNTTATVCIPATMGRQVTEHGHGLATVEGILEVRQEQDATRIEVGSGTYTFTARFVADAKEVA
jgi:hypothetical protein